MRASAVSARQACTRIIAALTSVQVGDNLLREARRLPELAAEAVAPGGRGVPLARAVDCLRLEVTQRLRQDVGSASRSNRVSLR
jgi:hypothetical protein